MTGIRPYHAVVLALFAGALTVQPAEPNMPMPKPPVSTPSVKPSPPPPNIPRPDTSSGSRGAIEQLQGTKSPAENKGPDGGKNSAAPGAGRLPAEIAAQQAVVENLMQEYKKHVTTLLQLPFNASFWKADGELTTARSNLADARKLHEEMRDRYAKDPTAENDKLVKNAEQAIFAAEKQVDVKKAKKDEIQNGLELTEKQEKARVEQIRPQYQKEADKLNALKVKYGEMPPDAGGVVDVLLGP